jgi:hypothetical protein
VFTAWKAVPREAVPREAVPREAVLSLLPVVTVV